MQEMHVIAVLALMNLAQLFFWGYFVHKLINKVMSRNYAEYDLVKNGPAQDPKQEIIDLEAEKQQQDVLDELNGMLPTKFA